MACHRPRGNAGDSDGPADALRAEERSIAALRGLVRRTREACALLRVVAEEDFGNRCVGWLAPETRASLQRLTLRGFATTGEGAHVASSLIEALMGQRTRVDLTGVDALASRLQDAAPLFFDGAARTFYRARELLQAARDARDGSVITRRAPRRWLDRSRCSSAFPSRGIQPR